jgi:hypothetical protein
MAATDPVWYMIADFAFTKALKQRTVLYRDRQTYIEGVVAGLQEAESSGLLLDLFDVSA